MKQGAGFYTSYAGNCEWASVSFLRIVDPPPPQHKFTSERQRTRLFSHPLSTGNNTYAINFLRQTPNAQRALSSSQHVSLQSACPEGRTDRKRHVCPTLVWPGCKETAEEEKKKKKKRKKRSLPKPTPSCVKNAICGANLYTGGV